MLRKYLAIATLGVLAFAPALGAMPVEASGVYVMSGAHVVVYPRLYYHHRHHHHHHHRHFLQVQACRTYWHHHYGILVCKWVPRYW